MTYREDSDTCKDYQIRGVILKYCGAAVFLKVVSFPVSTPQLFFRMLLFLQHAEKKLGVETGNEATSRHNSSFVPRPPLYSVAFPSRSQ